ncbi:hypothetical protein [uncultured Tateyamaria sp.]|uniref:hypothetical protein n=1 Tax=uncultured Tateyamaria sp. TaxID=455651 RepID=UPI002633A77A|nr:hypothetical protein [uncultured Tateyamaria sp.]
MTPSIAIRFLHRTPLLCLPLLVAGCATLSALTLPESRGTAGAQTSLTSGPCASARESAAGLIAPGVLPSILFDQAASLLNSALEAKAARFTATYVARISLDRLVPGHCLRMQRLTQDGEVLSDLEIKVASRGGSSLELVPQRLNMTAFAASSSAQDGTVSAAVSVSASISYVNRRQIDGPAPITSFSLPIAAARVTLDRTPSDVLNGQRSPFFPDTGDRPVNIAISVTEHGDGGDTVQGGLDGFAANAAALRTLLGI